MLRQLTLADMDEAATVHRCSFDHALPTLAGLHTPEEDRWFFRERMFSTCQLWGYFNDNELIGIIAFREGSIDQLYVLPSSQGQGVGTALLRVARGRHDSLSLWTFQRNAAARRFYEGQGFVVIKETDGFRNEENEPDAMYSWKRNINPLQLRLITCVTIVSMKAVKAKAAGYTGTGGVADQPADEEARRAAYKSARACAERTIEQPLSGAGRCRYH